MDVALWASSIDGISAALGELAPDHQSDFAANGEQYRQQLVELDDYVRQTVASIPREARILVTAHDAFNYFGSAYDIEVEGIQGLSTESEAGLRRIEDLVALIVERGVKAVFVESSVAERNIRALVEGAAARNHDIVVGGSLFSDAMGAHGTYEGTYIGMLDHNSTLITRALGGSAPELGLHGRLGGGV